MVSWSLSLRDLDGLCLWDQWAERVLSVSRLNPDLQVWIHWWWLNEDLKHIQCGNFVGRIHSELSHCPVMKDQWYYALNVLEKLGNKKSFLKYQCIVDTSFSLLLLLPSVLSTDHPTNEVSVEIDSFSRIELLRRLLVVLFESVEEDWLLFIEISYAKTEDSLGSISIDFLLFVGMMLCNSTSSLLCGSAFAFDLTAKTFTIGCDACSSSRSAGTSVLL